MFNSVLRLSFYKFKFLNSNLTRQTLYFSSHSENKKRKIIYFFFE
jgi:hypothetical protein